MPCRQGNHPDPKGGAALFAAKADPKPTQTSRASNRQQTASCCWFGHVVVFFYLKTTSIFRDSLPYSVITP